MVPSASPAVMQTCFGREPSMVPNANPTMVQTGLRPVFLNNREAGAKHGPASKPNSGADWLRPGLDDGVRIVCGSCADRCGSEEL